MTSQTKKQELGCKVGQKSSVLVYPLLSFENSRQGIQFMRGGRWATCSSSLLVPPREWHVLPIPLLLTATTPEGGNSWERKQLWFLELVLVFLRTLYYEGQVFLCHSKNETLQAHMSAVCATAVNTEGGAGEPALLTWFSTCMRGPGFQHARGCKRFLNEMVSKALSKSNNHV